MRRLWLVALALPVLVLLGTYATACSLGYLALPPASRWSVRVKPFGARHPGDEDVVKAVGKSGTSLVVASSGQAVMIDADGRQVPIAIEQHAQPRAAFAADGSAALRYYEPKLGGKAHVMRFDPQGNRLFERRLDDDLDEHCVGAPHQPGIAADLTGTWVIERFRGEVLLERLDQRGNITAAQVCQACDGSLESYAEGRIVAVTAGGIAWVDGLELVAHYPFARVAALRNHAVLASGDVAVVAWDADLGCGHQPGHQLALIGRNGCRWQRALPLPEGGRMPRWNRERNALVATNDGVALLVPYNRLAPRRLEWLPGFHAVVGVELHRWAVDGTALPDPASARAPGGRGRGVPHGLQRAPGGVARRRQPAVGGRSRLPERDRDAGGPLAPRGSQRFTDRAA